MSISALRNLQQSVAAATAAEAKAACDEEREVRDTIDGLEVVLKYEGAHGRGSVTVYSGVFIEGRKFGTEIEMHPWSVFKEMTVCYTCGDLMLKDQAEAIMAQAGVTDGECVEEPYPVDEGDPRYYWHVKSLESVVKLYKALESRKAA